jgi:hypothetical protein
MLVKDGFWGMIFMEKNKIIFKDKEITKLEINSPKYGKLEFIIDSKYMVNLREQIK